MNTNPQNQEPRKHALITAEQEALLRAFEQAKKMQFGEITIYIQTSRITRYEIRKSNLNTGSQKSNVEMMKDAEDDLDELETVAI
jgi:hypothetical protein